MIPGSASASVRLSAALDGLAVTFRGMTASPDEHNCECHWGSAEELAQLKVPDVDLAPGLLRRTWRAADWNDPAAVLRRILPQMARALVDGRVDLDVGMGDVGGSFARGQWQQWPVRQAAAVDEFLHAWWTHTLTGAHPAAPAHVVLPVVTEASATLTPWLATWGTLTGVEADRQLAEATAEWTDDLLDDLLPWSTWDDNEQMRVELTEWLVHHAPARLRAHGVPEEHLHRIRLLNLSIPARWEDPHWPVS